MPKKNKEYGEEIELSDSVAPKQDEFEDIKIDVSEPIEEPQKEPSESNETTLQALPVLTRAQKERLLLIVIGIFLVFLTWVIAANIPIYDTVNQANYLDLNETSNGTGEILELPTCPPPVVLTNCTTVEPCHCEQPQQVCPPITFNCRQCPDQYESCSIEKCTCEDTTPWQPPQDNDENVLSDLDFLVNPLLTVFNRSKPGTLYRLKQINKFLTMASAWFNIMSYRSANTGIHHVGQGGDVGRSCSVCRERNEWLRCVYTHNITGHALIKEMHYNDTIMRRPNFDWQAKYQQTAFDTSMYGYHTGWLVDPLSTPKERDTLKLEHYSAARFLYKIMTVEYVDADGKKGNCTLCKELANDKAINEHIRCIWRRSVSILELLHENDLENY